ncbi:GSCOCG00001463001-RA-CDS, partial [Cotesia congregata]
MATKVASSTQGSNDAHEGPGVSYASVVNPKSAGESLQQTPTANKECNKENIDQLHSAKERVPLQSQQPNNNNNNNNNRGRSSHKNNGKRFNSYYGSKYERRYYGQDEREGKGRSENYQDKKDLSQQRNRVNQSQDRLASADGTADGDFQTVAPKSARRKEKFQEKFRDHHHLQRERHKPERSGNPRNRSAGSKERVHKEKERSGEHTAVKEVKEFKEDKEEVESGEAQPVKYVAAPLPAVNPWTKSSLAAPPAVSSPANPVSTPVSLPVQVQKEQTPVQVQREKRVLQPQQQ